MENLKIEKSEKVNIWLEKKFEQDFIKNILSKLHWLDEIWKKELENFVWAEFDETQNVFYLNSEHKNSISMLEKLVWKKEKNIEK